MLLGATTLSALLCHVSLYFSWLRCQPAPPPSQPSKCRLYIMLLVSCTSFMSAHSPRHCPSCYYSPTPLLPVAWYRPPLDMAYLLYGASWDESVSFCAASPACRLRQRQSLSVEAPGPAALHVLASAPTNALSKGRQPVPIKAHIIEADGARFARWASGILY